MAISTTADSGSKFESRLEVMVVTEVTELLGEDIVGLEKTCEAALEPSDTGLKFLSRVGDIATSLFVFLRRSNALIAPVESSSDCSSCSVIGQSVVGLLCGDATITLPAIASGSRRNLGMSVSVVFLSCLVTCGRRSAGVFPYWKLAAWVKSGWEEGYGCKLVEVSDGRGAGGPECAENEP